MANHTHLLRILRMMEKKRCIKGRGKKFTPEESKIFNVAFNMGYAIANKRKKLK